jgi:Ubiquitin interaction motif
VVQPQFSPVKAIVCHGDLPLIVFKAAAARRFENKVLLGRFNLIFDYMLTGYSIFIVKGTLPECEADFALLVKPHVPTNSPSVSSGGRTRTQSEEEDEELKRVLQMSLEETDEPLKV